MAAHSPDDFESNDIRLRHYTAKEIVARMWPIIRPHRRGLAWAAFLVAGAGLVMAVVPLFTKFVIDVAIPKESLRLTVIAMGIFVTIQMIRMVTWYRAQRRLLVIREEITYAMRTTGFQHLQRLCMRFHGQFPSGFLHDRVFERSICAISGFLAVIFSNLAVYATGLVFSLIACLWLSVPMTLLLLVCALAYVATSRHLSPRIREKSLAANEAHSEIHGYILDKLRGTKTVQAFALEERVQDDFERRIEPVKGKWISAQKEMLKLSFITEGMSYLITAAVFVIGVYSIFNWDMKIGTLVAFIGYQGQFISLTTQLANVYGQFGSASAGFDQLFSVLDTQSTVVEKPDARMPDTITGVLELEHINFSYGNEQVLFDISMRLEPGQTIALVGRSGSGKTTITNLLMRFYDPDSGRVALDGHDIRDLPVRDYRANFGVVLQDPYLFDDTVAANLRVVRPQATDADIWEVLEQARAADFVRKLPNGLNDTIGEGGCRLSGGQRQRLAIARCMLLKARFLVLDEATSALDNETEAIIQQAMTNLFRRHTSIVIAHRLSTIRSADRILVMDEGRVIEGGTFEELLELNGTFHHLYTIATSTSLRRIKMEEAGFA